MARNLALLDSSEDEDFIIMPPLQPIIDADDDYQNMLQLLHPILGMMQRIHHIKIYNYIENIVNNYNNIDFIMHFRLSRRVAYGLIDQFSVSDIFTSMENLTGRLKITAEKHILCFLWFVGHQSASYRDVADIFGITISTLFQIISRVSEFLVSLALNVIKYPTAAEKRETATFYEETKGFPGIIGAIDGSHVRIDKPVEDPDSYINRKQYFSLNIQGTVNHEMKFIDVFVGYPGSVHDARVFRNSSIRDDLHELCGNDYFLLGDSAYPCLKELIVPYRDNGHLTRAQRIFNRKLSSCRVIIENAFGCLKQRFRHPLYHFKLRDIIRMVQVIYACCVLHNMANLQELQFFEPPINEYPDIEAQNIHIEFDNDVPRELENGMQRRDELCRLLT